MSIYHSDVHLLVEYLGGFQGQHEYSYEEHICSLLNYCTSHVLIKLEKTSTDVFFSDEKVYLLRYF